MTRRAKEKEAEKKDKRSKREAKKKRKEEKISRKKRNRKEKKTEGQKKRQGEGHLDTQRSHSSIQPASSQPASQPAAGQKTPDSFSASRHPGHPSKWPAIKQSYRN